MRTAKRKNSNRVMRNVLYSWAIVGAMAFGAGIGAGLVINAPEAKAEAPTKFVVMKTVPLEVELQRHVYDAAQEYGLDWTLLMAVIQKESRYEVNAISDCGDFGLMQINKINHGDLSVTLGIHDFLNPRDNVRAGAYLLRRLFDKYQDPHMALMAYNMGETGASEWWEKGVYTSAYSRDVIGIQRELKKSNQLGVAV